MNLRSLLLLTTVAALPLVACSGGSRAEDVAAARGLVVRTALVERRDLDDTLVLTGTLRPRAQVQVVSEASARLLRIVRDEGSRVA